jgi:predicted metal-binding membrane protein
MSPDKQRCLNRCHNHRPLAAFGVAADWDVFRLGFAHGFWCVGSCWAAMLLPMMLPTGHLAAMAAVSVLMFCERLDPPRPPAWRWRGFDTAVRYGRLWLRSLQPEIRN